MTRSRHCSKLCNKGEALSYLGANSLKINNAKSTSRRAVIVDGGPLTQPVLKEPINMLEAVERNIGAQRKAWPKSRRGRSWSMRCMMVVAADTHNVEDEGSEPPC